MSNILKSLTKRMLRGMVNFGSKFGGHEQMIKDNTELRITVTRVQNGFTVAFFNSSSGYANQFTSIHQNRCDVVAKLKEISELVEDLISQDGEPHK